MSPRAGPAVGTGAIEESGAVGLAPGHVEEMDLPVCELEGDGDEAVGVLGGDLVNLERSTEVEVCFGPGLFTFDAWCAYTEFGSDGRRRRSQNRPHCQE